MGRPRAFLGRHPGRALAPVASCTPVSLRADRGRGASAFCPPRGTMPLSVGGRTSGEGHGRSQGHPEWRCVSRHPDLTPRSPTSRWRSRSKRHAHLQRRPRRARRRHAARRPPTWRADGRRHPRAPQGLLPPAPRRRRLADRGAVGLVARGRACELLDARASSSRGPRGDGARLALRGARRRPARRAGAAARHRPAGERRPATAGSPTTSTAATTRYRLCQEAVLGIGGVRMLRALGTPGRPLPHERGARGAAGARTASRRSCSAARAT